MTAHDPLQPPATTLTWLLPAGARGEAVDAGLRGRGRDDHVAGHVGVPGVQPVGGVRAAAPAGEQVAERAGLVPEGQLGVVDAEPFELRDVADERAGEADLAGRGVLLDRDRPRADAELSSIAWTVATSPAIFEELASSCQARMSGTVLVATAFCRKFRMSLMLSEKLGPWIGLVGRSSGPAGRSWSRSPRRCRWPTSRCCPTRSTARTRRCWCSTTDDFIAAICELTNGVQVLQLNW